jgi:hypothetical protein
MKTKEPKKQWECNGKVLALEAGVQVSSASSAAAAVKAATTGR